MPTQSNVQTALQVVISILLLVLSVAGSLAVQTGWRTNEALEQLTVTVHGLTLKLTVLEQQVQRLPPPALQLRIDRLEQRMDRCEVRNQHDHGTNDAIGGEESIAQGG